MERIIKASSDPGDTVFDPFLGCATALEAARRLGRKWIGIDMAIHAIKRVAQVRLIERCGLAAGEDFTVKSVSQTLTFKCCVSCGAYWTPAMLKWRDYSLWTRWGIGNNAISDNSWPRWAIWSSTNFRILVCRFYPCKRFWRKARGFAYPALRGGTNYGRALCLRSQTLSSGKAGSRRLR